MSIYEEEYIKVIKEHGGSTAQNRFKFQRFWAISKINELYENKDEFIVFFESACDIDVLINKEMHFYQVKTDKNKNFTIKRLIEIKKNNKYSILLKLAMLERDYKNVKSLNIVSNNYLFEKDKNDRNLQIICLNNLKDDVKNQVKNHIQEKSTMIPDLSKYFYIKSDLCLDNSFEMLLGHTVKFLEKNFDTNNIRASYFLNWLLKETEERSTYEYDIVNYNDAITKKGITKEQFLQMLKYYDSAKNEILKKVDKKIDDYSDDMYHSHELRKALKEITRIGLTSVKNKNMLEKIRKYILELFRY